MIADKIRIALKDIIKFFPYFLFLVLLITSTSVGLISMFLSITDNLTDEVQEGTTYTAIPISFDCQKDSILIDRLNDFYSNNGYSYFINESLNAKFKSHIFVILGKYSDKSNKRITWAIDKSSLDKFLEKDLKGLKILPLETLNNEFTEYLYANNLINDGNTKLIVAENPYFRNLRPYNLDKDYFIDLVTYTKFTDAEKSKAIDSKFENIFLNSSLLLKKQEYSNIEELNFIFSYILPYFFILTISILISYTIFLKSIYKSLYNEYKIHMICGADLKTIFIRNELSTLFIFLLNSFLINILNKFSINIILILNIFFTVSMVGICSLINYIILKREDFNLYKDGDFIYD